LFNLPALHQTEQLDGLPPWQSTCY
jgi:hypothetical protein